MTFVAPYQAVINEALADEALRGIAAQEMTYIKNCTGGYRPSDAARVAVRYILRAVQQRSVEPLASPTARERMQNWLERQV